MQSVSTQLSDFVLDLLAGGIAAEWLASVDLAAARARVIDLWQAAAATRAAAGGSGEGLTVTLDRIGDRACLMVALPAPHPSEEYCHVAAVAAPPRVDLYALARHSIHDVVVARVSESGWQKIGVVDGTDRAGVLAALEAILDGRPLRQNPWITVCRRCGGLDTKAIRFSADAEFCERCEAELARSESSLYAFASIGGLVLCPVVAVLGFLLVFLVERHESLCYLAGGVALALWIAIYCVGMTRLNRYRRKRILRSEVPRRRSPP